nr:putative ribonuclease H-like domain-containing protein [Tanacetum cinerariifolium]
MQTHTSNNLHNAIMEAGGKDRLPMLAPGNYVQWKSIIKRHIDTKPNHELIHYCLKNPPYKYTWADKAVPVAEGSSETTIERYMENYKNFSQDIRDQLNAEAEAVQIILTGMDNDIYSTVDACPNACKMWKAIERLKQCESIDVQDLETNLYWEFGKFTSRDGESLESYYSRFYKMMNELVRNQCDVTNHQVNVQFLLQLQPESQRINKGTRYDNQRIGNVAGAMETVGTTVVQKFGIQCYNCKDFGHVARECHKPKRVKDAAYQEKMLLYDADDSRPIFDTEPLQKVSNNDNYNVFSIESEHPEQSKSVNDTYPIEQDAHNMIIDSLDMSYDREQLNQDDDDDLTNERDLLASLIEKLKCEIDMINELNQTISKMKKELFAHQETISILSQAKEAQIKLYKTREDKELDKFIDLENKVKKINELNQTISKMKKELFAHQEPISILSQAKEAQIKLYKTREDKKLDKVIDLENKVKVLDSIVYKTGQSVQIMKMLNRNCKTSFAKPEFLKKAQRANPRLYDIGIHHQTSVARTPEQNGVVERQNRTLIKAARTMLSAAKVPLFFCAEAIVTTCFTQNHGENLDKMKKKGDACIFAGYSTQSRAYKVFNQRTRVIVEAIHVNFDELPQMASDHVSSNPVPQCQSTKLKHISLSPGPQCQENVPYTARTITTSNELDLLFSLMFDELLNGSSQVVSKSLAVTTADAPNICQQHITPLNTHTTPEPTFEDDEFINIFCTPVQDRGETSSRHVDSLNMHTFYQRHPSEHRWTKDHPLEQVIGIPSQLVRTRRQLESDGEMCMFVLTVSRTEPKNIKEAMADSAWIESMQEELHQFDRLDV